MNETLRTFVWLLQRQKIDDERKRIFNQLVDGDTAFPWLFIAPYGSPEREVCVSEELRVPFGILCWT